MEEERREKLFTSIKRDDVKVFGTMMTPEVLCAVFGRFPLLSLLYLYRAKRIVKRYYKELIKERPPVREEPFREAEERFRTVAGKCLRYYILSEAGAGSARGANGKSADDKATMGYASASVSPLEMLAILGRGRELKKLYAVYPNAQKYLPAVHRLYYTRLGQGVSATGKTLDLPPEPISYEERRHSAFFAWLSLAIGLVFAAVTVFLSVYFGLGNDRFYYKVRTDAAFLSALQADQTVYLKSDVSLSLGVETFDRQFEGNDHVVRLHAPFADKFEGDLRNVIFVLEPDFTGDAVIGENSGTIHNVRVVAEGLSVEKGGEYMGLLTAVNTGSIDGCYAVLSVEITGDAGGDCYFAPFAGDNTGAIHNCHAEGTIRALNVDVAGVAGKNEKTGVITDCAVNMELRERSDIKGWTPNVAGVTDHNEGAIDGCAVSGSVTSTLVSPELGEEDHVMSAYAAGVACVNVGSVKGTTVRATVTAETTGGAAFAGGVVSLNTTLTADPTASGIVEHCSGLGAVRALAQAENNSYAGGIAAVNDTGSTVSSCRQTAMVLAESPDRYYDFTGGIVGSNGGVVENSFFIGTLPDYDEDSLVGGICGMTYLYGDGYFMQYTVDLVGNAYLSAAVHASGGLKLVSIGQSLYSAVALERSGGASLLNLGATAATLDEIKAMEIYYE